MYYFDNAASTKVLEEAAKAAYNVMLNCYGNPSSLHKFGIEAEKILTDFRQTLADLFLRDKDEFIVTSCATESTNIAINGVVRKNKKKKKIITSSVEHKATENCLKNLEEKGFTIVKVKTKNNRFYAEDFIDLVDENTLMVSCMHVNNENGLILPIYDISKGVKEKDKDVIVHIDAAQSFLKLPIDLKYIDLLSASGHKVFAPKGIGFLFIKKGTKISPISYGGGQEYGIRPGTQATPLIKAFDVAIKYSILNKNSILKHYNDLKNILIDNLKEIEGIHFNFNEFCVPYIINISLENLKSQVLLQFLEEKGFMVSAGSACSKNKNNNVLLNLGFNEKIADSAIRISLSHNTTKDSILKLAETIKIANKTIIKV